MGTRIFVYSAVAAVILSACFGSARKEQAEPEEIYFDYKITGEEGNDSVTVILKFREFDEYGQAITLNEGSVTLDGKVILADSTPITGPFYSVTRHVKEFTGRHTILVSLTNKKKFKEGFQFMPFTIRSGLKDTVERDKITLQLEGLEKRDFVRVLLMDTSFTGDGINRLDTVWNNRLAISKGDLSWLESGPINMELTKEHERPLENKTGAGGTISVYYSIRREFWLKE